MNATDNNGNQPVTQITRDQMAQNDHDKLVEYGVMLQNIMSAQLRLETQIKDLITGQAQALAAWEASSGATHDAQDKRIRAIEDLATVWVPKAQSFDIDIIQLKKDIQAFKDNDNKFLGGWKTLVFIGGIVAGIAGFIISIVDIIVHLPK